MAVMHYLPTIDSTNEEAKRLVAGGLKEPLLILADRQELGRGRSGNMWESPEGNLYLTYVLQDQKQTAPAMTPWSFLACLALEKTLEPLLHDPQSFSLKWPNDVLLDGKKLAGILVERLVHPTRFHNPQSTVTVLIGMGVNVFTLPEVEEYPVTALSCHAALERDSIKLLAHSWLEHFHTWIDIYDRKGFLPIQEEWMKHSWLPKGSKLSINQAGKHLEGTYRGIANNGSLCVEQASGQMEYILAGRVR